MILLIDNYDSFVFNLARYIEELGRKVMVVRNDQINADQVRALGPEAIIFSPGPCGPDDAGNSLSLIDTLKSEFPMLGVCLGHQSIAQVFGGTVLRAKRPVHGMTSEIRHGAEGLFGGLNNPLQETATGPEGEVMAFAHKELPIFGVQFHPESVLTEQGHELLANFMNLTCMPGASK